MHTTEIPEFFRSTFPYQDRKVILSSLGPLVPCLSIICFLNTGVAGEGGIGGEVPGLGEVLVRYLCWRKLSLWVGEWCVV